MIRRPKQRCRRVSGRLWDYEQTAESADGLEEQIRLLSQAIETAKATVKAYTVHFDLNGGTGEFPEIKTTFEGSGLIPENEPVRSGYIFTGWTAGGRGSDAETQNTASWRETRQ